MFIWGLMNRTAVSFLVSLYGQMFSIWESIPKGRVAELLSKCIFIIKKLKNYFAKCLCRFINGVGKFQLLHIP